ncbi:MAG: hypothetical protein ACI841_001423 [Planctomycetota bacterium]|jgi:hypothetical protein
MKFHRIFTLGLACLLSACASTTGHRRIGVTAPIWSDVLVTGDQGVESVDIQGLNLTLQLETYDQTWIFAGLGGRVYDFAESDLLSRSTEFTGGVLRELGPLNGATQPFVEATLRKSQIYDGLGTQTSFDLGGGIRREIGPETYLEFGIVHQFEEYPAAFGRELDGWIARVGLLIGF